MPMLSLILALRILLALGCVSAGYMAVLGIGLAVVGEPDRPAALLIAGIVALAVLVINAIIILGRSSRRFLLAAIVFNSAFAIIMFVGMRLRPTGFLVAIISISAAFMAWYVMRERQKRGVA